MKLVKLFGERIEIIKKILLFTLSFEVNNLSESFAAFLSNFCHQKLKMYALGYSRNGTIVGSIVSFIITLLSKS